MPSSELEPPPPKGLLTSDPESLATRTLRAWELFAAAAAQADPEGSTRSRRRSAGQMMISLGTWQDSRGISDMVADAHAGRRTMEPWRDAADRLAQIHASASRDEVLAAVQRSADQTAAWLGAGLASGEGLLTTPSPLGPLPMGTVVHAAVFQLAVTARDLQPAGALPVPELDALGLVALMDATGAVGARCGLVARAAAVGRHTAVATNIIDGGWTTVLHDEAGFPGVLGPEEVLLDLAGGRGDIGAIGKQVRFRDARGLLALSPVVDELPDLPGGPLLRQAARFARLFGGRR